MKIVCKECHTEDILITEQLNPNDDNTIREYFTDAYRSDGGLCFCNACQEHQEFEVVGDADFSAWMAGEKQMFIASIERYSKKSGSLGGRADNELYSKDKAVAYLLKYIKERDIVPGKEEYHLFTIREFSPPVAERKSYPDMQSVFDLSGFMDIAPCCTIKI